MMIKFFDSYEVETLKKLIASKEQYLQKTTGNTYQIIQREIMFLKNDVLPIVLNNTSVIHSEIVKYVIRAFDKALEFKCNGIFIYIPINENYTERPLIGIANSRSGLEFGEPGAMQLFAEIINEDGNEAKVQPINLPLDELL